MKYKNLPIQYNTMTTFMHIATVEGYLPGYGHSKQEAFSNAMKSFLTGFFARCAAEDKDKENALASKEVSKPSQSETGAKGRVDQPKSSD